MAEIAGSEPAVLGLRAIHIEVNEPCVISEAGVEVGIKVVSWVVTCPSCGSPEGVPVVKLCLLW